MSVSTTSDSRLDTSLTGTSTNNGSQDDGNNDSDNDGPKLTSVSTMYHKHLGRRRSSSSESEEEGDRNVNAHIYTSFGKAQKRVCLTPIRRNSRAYKPVESASESASESADEHSGFLHALPMESTSRPKISGRAVLLSDSETSTSASESRKRKSSVSLARQRVSPLNFRNVVLKSICISSSSSEDETNSSSEERGPKLSAQRSDLGNLDPDSTYGGQVEGDTEERSHTGLEHLVPNICSERQPSVQTEQHTPFGSRGETSVDAVQQAKGADLDFVRSSISKTRVPFSAFVKRKLDMNSIMDIRRTKLCCLRRCLKVMSSQHILQIRECFFRQNTSSRAFSLQSVITRGDASRPKAWTYRAGNQIVCYTAFKLIYGVSNSLVHRLKSCDGGNPTIGRLWGRDRSPSGNVVISWLQEFFDQNVEHHPGRPVRLLPDSYTKKEVFKIFSQQTSLAAGGVTCSAGNFRKLWIRHFPDVKIPAVNRFSKCSQCEKYKANRDKLVTEAAQKNEEKLALHRQQQSEERLKLGKHRKKCFSHPEKYLGLVIDGMDQKKTRLPHWPRFPKNVDESCLIQMHLIGCMVFNGTLKSKVFLTYPNLHNDSNLIITIIQKVLFDWVGELPRTLYLQLDNTARENKNNLLMSFLHYLVYKGVFAKVKINFLLVGHTHDQIDQMFSRISTKLAKVKAFTLDGLSDAIVSAYDPHPEVVLLWETFDFRRFAFKDSCIVVNTIHNLSFNHQFKIVRPDSGDGVPVCWAKQLSTSADWLPEGGIVFLKSEFVEGQIFCAQGIPLRKKGSPPPTLSQEGLEHSILEIEKGITILFEYFSEVQVAWWKAFFSLQRSYNDKLLQVNLLPSQPFSFHSFVDSQPVEEAVDGVEEEHVEDDVLGPTREIYVGHYRNQETLQRERENMEGDLTDLEIKSMICVAAEGDVRGRPFWLAKVLKIIETSEDGSPVQVEVLWYTAGEADDFWTAKYFPEMVENSNGSRRRLKEFHAVLDLRETTVLSYNFTLQKNKTLYAKTLDRIRIRLADFGART